MVAIPLSLSVAIISVKGQFMLVLWDDLNDVCLSADTSKSRVLTSRALWMTISHYNINNATLALPPTFKPTSLLRDILVGHNCNLVYSYSPRFLSYLAVLKFNIA